MIGPEAFKEMAMRQIDGVLAAAGSLLLALPAAAAGLVEVKYTEPDKYVDIGFGSYERERNLQALSQSFQRLAQSLPEGQTLKVEVLDIDLAGEPRLGSVRDLRVLRGGADWPRIKIRYSLQSGNTTLKSGDALLSDPTYLFAQRPINPREGPLPYEQRMLVRWFTDTFMTPTTSP
jgi:Protein of unknown function (DUF3016)